jgi:NAD(P)H-flavin reductase/ferredoxin
MLTFDGKAIPLQPGQTVLAGLETAGIAVESSCRAGACQSCLVQAVSGDVPKRAQAGLSAAQVAQGLFMACVCVPEGPLTVARAGQVHQRVDAEVVSLDRLSDSVLRVRLKPLSGFTFRPGQFVRLITDDGLIRSYSIATTPAQHEVIELHVRLLSGGRMSTRLSQAKPGDRLTVSGPSGGCFYDGVDADRPIILAGAGTGLAPLWGLLHDALARGHRGPITLYHGALDAGGLYLVDELKDLERRHPNLSYRPCVKSADSGDLASLVAADPHLKTAALFLCGDAPLVERMRKTLFLAGARLADIRADAFAAAA